MLIPFMMNAIGNAFDGINKAIQQQIPGILNQ